MDEHMKKLEKKLTLKRKCSEEITRGFKSKATGTEFFYSSKIHSQINLLFCLFSESEQFVSVKNKKGEGQRLKHTNKEIKNVIKDFLSFKDEKIKKLYKKTKEIEKSKNDEDSEKVKW